MPLGVRDMLMIMRARDEASRIVGQVGGAIQALGKDGAGAQLALGAGLTAMGAGMIAAGGALASFLSGAVSDAKKYNQEAALTLTQVDQLGVSLDQVKDIGRRVADEIPAPFEQMQGSLYDIFSSMDVNVTDAEQLLREFSKAGVAGQTDVQTAGRATIAILNGFHLPVTDLNRVMDVQFQLVRKGVGTYGEFASSIGRAIPAAQRAGQSVETLGGMLAFLTRNGLSADMAATSAGRALELMANPTVSKRIEDMGIATKDATGEFRPLTDVLRDMNDKFKDMTGPERAKALQDLFKGGGNAIQARRFFDTVFTNFDEFEQRVGEMQNSAGSLDAAYNLMFEQPQSQMQLFSNRWDTFKTEIGDALIPILVKLMEWGGKILDWFKNLSPEMKKVIAIIAAVVSAFLIIGGAILVVVGIFLMLGAAAAVVGIDLGILFAVIFAVIAIVALLVIGFIYAYTHFQAFHDTVDAIGRALKEAIGWIIEFGKALFSGDWSKVGQMLSDLWNDIKTKFVEGLKALWDLIKKYVPILAKALWEWLKDVTPKVIAQLWEWLKAFGDWLWNSAIPQLLEWGKELAIAFGNWLVDTAIPWLWEHLGEWLSAFESWLYGTALPWLWDKGVELAGALVDWIINTAIPWLWDHLGQAMSALMDWVLNTAIPWLFSQGTALSSALVDWVINTALPWLINHLGYLLGFLIGFLAALPGKIVELMQWAAHALVDWVVTSAIPWLWDHLWEWNGKLWDFITGLPGRIVDAISAAVPALVNWVINSIPTLLSNLGNWWTNFFNWLRGLPGLITGALWDAGRWLLDVGKKVIEGLWNGITSMDGWLKDKIGGFASSVIDGFMSGFGIFSPSRKMMPVGGYLVEGLNVGMQKQPIFDLAGKVLNTYQAAFDAASLQQPTYGAGILNNLTNPGLQPTGSGSTIMIHEGAVQISVTGDASDETVDKIKKAVEDALNEVVDGYNDQFQGTVRSS